MLSRVLSQRAWMSAYMSQHLPLECGSCREIIDDREVEVGRLNVEQGVGPLYSTRADECYISQHIAVLVPDVRRAAWFLPLHVHPLHPLQMFVKAELVSIVDTFLETADILKALKNRGTAVALARSSPLPALPLFSTAFLRLLSL